VLQACRRAGYETVQYNMACSGLDPLPAAIPPAVADSVRAAAAETGAGIAAVSATYNMIHPSPGERERGRRGFRAIAAAAPALGATLLTLCTGSCDPLDQWRFHPGNAGPEAWREMCREFELLHTTAEEHGVFLGVEPELANVVSSARRARELLDTFPNGRIRIVLDAANLFETATLSQQRALIDEAVDLLGESIALAHAKDRLPGGRFTHAGAGVLDYPYYVAALRRAGFRGSLVTHGLDARQAPGVAAFLKAALEQAA
jgi:sugar phosphate isomerase/epimerase